jgi:hypothetical protein
MASPACKGKNNKLNLKYTNKWILHSTGIWIHAYPQGEELCAHPECTHIDDKGKHF